MSSDPWQEPDVVTVRFERDHDGLIRWIGDGRYPWHLQDEPPEFGNSGLGRLLEPRRSFPARARLRIWPAVGQQAASPLYSWWRMTHPQYQHKPLLHVGWTIAQVSAQAGLRVNFGGDVLVLGDERLSDDLSEALGHRVLVKCANWTTWAQDAGAERGIIIVAAEPKGRIAELRETAVDLSCPIVVWAAGQPPIDDTPLIEIVRDRTAGSGRAGPAETSWMTSFIDRLLDGHDPEEAHRLSSVVCDEPMFELRNFAEEWAPPMSRHDSRLGKFSSAVRDRVESGLSDLQEHAGVVVVVLQLPRGSHALGERLRGQLDREAEDSRGPLTWSPASDVDDSAVALWSSLRSRIGAKIDGALLKEVQATTRRNAYIWVSHSVVEVGADAEIPLSALADYLGRLRKVTADSDHPKYGFPRGRLVLFLPVLFSYEQREDLVRAITFPAMSHFSLKFVDESVAPLVDETEPLVLNGGGP